MNYFSRFFDNLIKARNDWLNKPLYHSNIPIKKVYQRLI